MSILKCFFETGTDKTLFDDLEISFTESEMIRLLKNYQLEAHMSEMKEWYDGYRFGDADMHCLWDVISDADLVMA